MEQYGSRARPHEEERVRHYEERNGDQDDRTRGRDRSRSRSPSRRLEREWDRGKRRSPAPSSRFQDDTRDHERQDRRQHNDEPPSRTVMLRGLPPMAFEAEIRHILDPQVAAYVDIRVPRNPEGGNRGFGFVEFANMESASAWMEQVQGAIYVNETRIIVHFCEDREMFSKPDRPPVISRPPRPAPLPPSDWECSRVCDPGLREILECRIAFCFQCGCNNFRNRATCFRCEALRSEAENFAVPSADEHVGLIPCNTLLLRNLNAATDESRIISALLSIMPTSSIRTAKIMRDPRSQCSAGYGFVQFTAQHDCTEMYNCLMRVNPPLTIDGQQIAVSFAKLPLNELLAPQPNPYPTPFPNSAYRASTPTSHSGIRPGYGQGNDVNSAAAVAQQALQQMHKSQMSASIVQQHLQYQQHPGHPQVPAGYVYDPNSGYYYNANSGLYYDTKTQYYWNPVAQQYLAWNPQTQSYVSVPPAGQAGTSAAVLTETSEEKPKGESEKEKQAKKIVQEMEKWAKSQNLKQPPPKKMAPVPDVKMGAVASVFSEPQEEEAIPKDVQKNLSYKTITIAPPTGPAVPLPIFADRKNHGPTPEPDNHDSDNRRSGSPSSSAAAAESVIARQQAVEERFVDWDRLACLLCKRQLADKEKLTRHLDESDLHRNNLSVHRRQTMTEEEIELLEAQRDPGYRDRAKERRQKYGEPEPAPPLRGATAAAASASRKRRNPSESNTEEDQEESPAAGLGNNNVGAKLMKAMGWSEGRGLGKAKQGIVDPVEARAHAGTSGLGSSEAGAPDILPTDSYANKVRKTMRNRFRQMHE